MVSTGFDYHERFFLIINYLAFHLTTPQVRFCNSCQMKQVTHLTADLPASCALGLFSILSISPIKVFIISSSSFLSGFFF